MPTPIETLRSSLRELDRTLLGLRLADEEELAGHLDELDERIADLRRAAGLLRRAQEPGQPR
ncbi:MAG TPA: hypothetical protein VGE07_16630 [Herpetosiphonaceae bacterium]